LGRISILVAYLGYGSHGTCHARNVEGGAKIAWQKLKFSFNTLDCDLISEFSC